MVYQSVFIQFLSCQTVLLNSRNICLGLPVPTITWRRNRVTITGHIEMDDPGRMRSTLLLSPLKRSDYPMTLSCSTSNSERSRPLEQSFDIDMERK